MAQLTPARFVALYELAVTPGSTGGHDKRTITWLIDADLIEWCDTTDRYHVYRATSKGLEVAREHLHFLQQREAKGRMFRSDAEQPYQDNAAAYRAKIDLSRPPAVERAAKRLRRLSPAMIEAMMGAARQWQKRLPAMVPTGTSAALVDRGYLTPGTAHYLTAEGLAALAEEVPGIEFGPTDEVVTRRLDMFGSTLPEHLELRAERITRTYPNAAAGQATGTLEVPGVVVFTWLCMGGSCHPPVSYYEHPGSASVAARRHAADPTECRIARADAADAARQIHYVRTIGDGATVCDKPTTVDHIVTDVLRKVTCPRCYLISRSSLVSGSATPDSVQASLTLSENPVECMECGERFATVAESIGHPHMSSSAEHTGDAVAPDTADQAEDGPDAEPFVAPCEARFPSGASCLLEAGHAGLCETDFGDLAPADQPQEDDTVRALRAEVAKLRRALACAVGDPDKSGVHLTLSSMRKLAGLTPEGHPMPGPSAKASEDREIVRARCRAHWRHWGAEHGVAEEELETWTDYADASELEDLPDILTAYRQENPRA